MNNPPRSIGFVPSRAAWLFGHASGSGARRLQGCALLLSAGLLVAAASFWWAQRPGAVPATAETAAPPPRAAVVGRAPVLAAAERARINSVVRRLNTPWSSIFEALENQAQARVALLSLETDADRGAVRVMTEGPSLDELLLHAERVQATSPFVRTRLLRIEPPETGGASVGAAAADPGLTRLSFDLVIQP